MVGLLLALAAAVFYQTILQGFFLGSVSAYYYTAAQAVFVGALIGLGVSMIALQGMTDAENVFLNLGGIFAIMVAIVPTGRGPDFQAAVLACQNSGGSLLTQRASKLDCPSVQALADAAKANVENNITALLITGGLTLILATFIFSRGRAPQSEASSTPPGEDSARRWILAELIVAALLWAGVLIALVVSVDWILSNAHYTAAISLAICILLVVGANALRRKEIQVPGTWFGQKAAASESRQGHLYVWIAGAMFGAALVVVVLWLAGVISLFWVEISVALFFLVFWITQTVELEVARIKAMSQVPGSAPATATAP
jgi:hypothetical protein